MKPDVGMWGTLSRIVAGLILAAIVAGAVVILTPLIHQKERLHKELLRLDAQIEKQQKENRQLEATVKLLNRDPKAVERLAREKLGYAKPGETVIRFVPAVTNTPNH